MNIAPDPFVFCCPRRFSPWSFVSVVHHIRHNVLLIIPFIASLRARKCHNELQTTVFLAEASVQCRALLQDGGLAVH